MNLMAKTLVFMVLNKGGKRKFLFGYLISVLTHPEVVVLSTAPLCLNSSKNDVWIVIKFAQRSSFEVKVFGFTAYAGVVFVYPE